MNSISPIAYILQPIILIAIIGNLFFLINYTLSGRSNWRATPGGKITFYSRVLITAIMLLIGATFFFEDYPGREIWRFFVYTGFAFDGIVSNIILIRAQIRGDKLLLNFLRRFDSSLSAKSDRELRQVVSKIKKMNPDEVESYLATLNGPDIPCGDTIRENA